MTDVLGGKRFRVERADCLEFMAALPEASVDLIFTSPPYESQRLYLEDGRDLSIARDTEEWVTWMGKVVRASLRVCRGLCAFVVEGQTKDYRYSCSPALLMADLHRAGICLRKPPIYKRVGIPGSGGPDWLRSDTEWIICATNGGKLPWSDNVACGAPPKYGPGGRMTNRTKNGKRVHERNFKDLGASGHVRQGVALPDVANPGNVIECAVGGGKMGEGDRFAAQGEAPFPEKLAEFFILSFCPPGGICFDPFAGSGTTAAVAVRHGRRALACDLRQSQANLTLRRLGEETPLALLE